MPSLAAENQIVNTPGYTLWREPALLYVKLAGDVADAESVAWRAAVDAHLQTAGVPPFMILDVCEANATSTMPGRMRTAAWARALLKKVREGVIYTGDNGGQTDPRQNQRAQTSFVIRALLRLVGMANVSIVGDPAALDATYERYRRELT